MFKVLKEKGSWSNVIVMNTDDSFTVDIGRVSVDILSILEEDGYSTTTSDDTHKIDISDMWDIEVSHEIATKLSRKAMPMRKPIRTKADKLTSEQKKEVNKHIDAMDVMLGLASYK